MTEVIDDVEHVFSENMSHNIITESMGNSENTIPEDVSRNIMTEPNDSVEATIPTGISHNVRESMGNSENTIPEDVSRNIMTEPNDSVEATVPTGISHNVRESMGNSENTIPEDVSRNIMTEPNDSVEATVPTGISHNVRDPADTVKPKTIEKKSVRAFSISSRTKLLMNEYKQTKKEWKRPSPSFISALPRLPPPRKSFCSGDYNVTPPQDRSKSSGSGWSTYTTKKGLTFNNFMNVSYDVKDPRDVVYFYKKDMPSYAPRLGVVRENNVPSPGQYTSRFVSCGLNSEYE